jgi:ABC-2 type transport system ATP-binding protein
MGAVTVDPAIVSHRLTKRYGETLAVDGLNLAIPPGEVFGLLGPNGAGKTTTILMLLGLSEPTGGSLRVLGLDPAQEPLAVKRRVGYLPDSVGFYDQLSGRQNLAYTARLNGLSPLDAAERIDEALTDVGLIDRAGDPVGTYSRGMRQRLGVADALVKKPEVLILDEPTAAIDPQGVEEMLALIRRLAGRGVTVLLASHLLHQVQAICDRIGIFISGRLVACGPVSELARIGGGALRLEVQVAGGDAEGIVGCIPGVVSVEREGDILVIGAVGDIREALARALIGQGLVPVHLRVREEDLAEVYRGYFGAVR